MEVLDFFRGGDADQLLRQRGLNVAEKKKAQVIITTLERVADFYDVPPGTVRTWRAEGMPGIARHWDLKEIDKWVHATGRKTSRTNPKRLTDDPLLDESIDSEGLERYRMARAQLEEIKLAEQRGQVVMLDQMAESDRVMLAPLRQLQETLKRKQDHDTFKMVQEAIDEMERRLMGLADDSGLTHRQK